VLGDDPWSTGKAADVSDEVDYILGTAGEIIERTRGKDRVFRLGVNSAR